MDPALPAGLPCWQLWPDKLLTAGFRPSALLLSKEPGDWLVSTLPGNEGRRLAWGSLAWYLESLGHSFIHSFITVAKGASGSMKNTVTQR